jgi:putative flippase GtrA
MKKILDILKSEKFLELFRYGVVGVATTFVSWGTLWLLCYPLSVNPDIANVISIILAVLFAYAANKLIVFRTHCENLVALGREALSFFAARAATMVLETVGFSISYNILHLSPMAAKIVISVLVLIANYVLSKLFVFRKKQ